MAWWREVWTSEIADQYLRVDRQALSRLAVLVDNFWRASDEGLATRELAAEIRLQQQSFGLTPLDRTRLQWEVERAKPAEAAEKDEPPPVYDSRDVLRALK